MGNAASSFMISFFHCHVVFGGSDTTNVFIMFDKQCRKRKKSDHAGVEKDRDKKDPYPKMMLLFGYIISGCLADRIPSL